MALHENSEEEILTQLDDYCYSDYCLVVKFLRTKKERNKKFLSSKKRKKVKW